MTTKATKAPKATTRGSPARDGRVVYHREVPRAAHVALALATTVVWGCEVQTPVVMSAQATAELTECGFCDNPGGPEPEMPSEAFIDTVVITTHQLADEIDCRGCVELDECGAPHQRDCVCLDTPIRLSELDLGAILSEYSVENVSRDEEYCVSVATLRTPSVAPTTTLPAPVPSTTKPWRSTRVPTSPGSSGSESSTVLGAPDPSQVPPDHTPRRRAPSSDTVSSPGTP